jgi:hypothetical protein
MELLPYSIRVNTVIVAENLTKNTFYMYSCILVVVQHVIQPIVVLREIG